MRRVSETRREEADGGDGRPTQTEDQDDRNQAFARELQDGKVELKSCVDQVAREEEQHEAGDEEEKQVVLWDSVEDVESISNQMQGREGDKCDLVVHFIHRHLIIASDS